jgi:hypothetical protein
MVGIATLSVEKKKAHRSLFSVLLLCKRSNWPDSFGKNSFLVCFCKITEASQGGVFVLWWFGNGLLTLFSVAIVAQHIGSKGLSVMHARLSFVKKNSENRGSIVKEKRVEACSLNHG